MIYPARYKIIFNFYDKVNEEILKSFYYLIKYGGIGGKNRRGAGKFIFLNNGLNYTKNYNRLKLLECNQKFDSWQNAINFLGSVYWIYRAKNKHRDDKYYLGSAKFREKDRIPSKVIFEIFKNNDKYQAGYLLLYDEKDKNFSEQLDIFKNYLLDKLYSQYLNDVIRNNKKDFLRKTYDKLKNYIAQLGNFSFTEVKNG
jgi:CRISPR/Cas system CMR-associated protein Cmr1 (group 7 of RAMP superfamily)